MDDSSAQVKRSFEVLLEEIRKAIERHPASLREAALSGMLKTSEIYGKKLFTHYDHPDLPPTDNGLETLFRDTRRHERLITGHKSTARRTVREGAFLVPVLQQHARGNPPSAQDLRRVPESVWRNRLRHIQQARAQYDRPRRIRTNLKTHLDELVKRCRKIKRSRAP